MAVITLAEAKVFLQITGTTKDALITALIPEIEGHIIAYCNTDFYNTADPPVQVWPSGIKLTASQMIGYNMTTMSGGGGAIGLQSETQGGYSYSRGQNSSGMAYPDSIVKSLDKYKITRASFSSKMSQNNDRRGMTSESLAQGKYFDDVAGRPI